MTVNRPVALLILDGWGMRERAAMLGSTLNIQTEPNNGTIISIEIK